MRLCYIFDRMYRIFLDGKSDFDYLIAKFGNLIADFCLTNFLNSILSLFYSYFVRLFVFFCSIMMALRLWYDGELPEALCTSQAADPTNKLVKCATKFLIQ